MTSVSPIYSLLNQNFGLILYEILVSRPFLELKGTLIPRLVFSFRFMIQTEMGPKTTLTSNKAMYKNGS